MLQIPAEVGGIAAQPFDHICALYRGRAERDQLMLPFLKEGLEAGDACLCLATDGEGADLVSMLGREPTSAGWSSPSRATRTCGPAGSIPS